MASARSVEEIANDIRQAWKAGREIVPVVGAGISADSGIPVVTSVVRYFGKLQQYIWHRAYLPPSWENEEDILQKAQVYRDAPWKFIQHFGWLDRFQLNQDLLDGRPPSGEVIEESVREGLKAVLDRLNPHGMKGYKRLQKALLGIKKPDGTVVTPGILDWDDSTGGERFIDGLDATIDRNIRESVNEAGAVDIVRRVLSHFQEKVKARLDRSWSSSVPFDLVGDWKKLIQYFTHFQGDYADALFARLVAGRQPSQGHRFLAFLVKFLGVRTIFTYNFDNLIERSLEIEGVRAEVFAMEEGAALPHHTLVRDTVSVIKLHGGKHALLLDERLDHPVTDDYMKRFERIAGKDPLLLVVGCSGNDLRLSSLVSNFLDRDRKGSGPIVVWLHYEDEPPDFLEEKNSAHTRVTNNPGATLLHLHSRLRGCNPASRVPYVAHIQRPITLDVITEEGLKAIGSSLLRKSPKAYFLDGLPDPDARPVDTSYPGRSASQVLIEFANYWMRQEYHTIWVDLESVHTLAGVVGSIIDQCRSYDSSLPPSVLPLEESGEETGARGSQASRHIAVERVVHALRRTRYLVIFDGLETYVWPATAHHGVTVRCEREAGRRLENLHRFLMELAGRREELGESFICVGVDVFKWRHDERVLAGDNINLREHINEIHKNPGLWEVVTTGTDPEFKWTDFLRPAETGAIPLLRVTDKGEAIKTALAQAGIDPPERVELVASLVLFILSCFRRTRTLVALRTILGPTFGNPDIVDDVLEALAVGSPWAGLIRLEGGGYWFTRTVRDYVYDKASDSASKKSMEQLLASVCEASDNYRCAAFQLLLLAAAHQRIARVYFTEMFVQSHDTFAFLEYTYHRLSSVRYLAQLLGLIRFALDLQADEPWREILKGVCQSRQILREVWTSEPSDTLLGNDVFDTSGRDNKDMLNQVQEALRRQHQHDIHSLYRAWARSASVLRAQLPAEQLLNWTRDIVEDDLKFRCNSVVVGYHGAVPQLHIFTDNEGHMTEEVNPDAKRDIDSFSRFLKDFRVCVLIERTDYDEAMRERWSQLSARESRVLDSAGPKGIQELVDAGTFPTINSDRCRVVDCHYLIDIAVCILRYFQEFKTSNEELQKGIGYTLNLLSLIGSQIEKLEKSGSCLPHDHECLESVAERVKQDQCGPFKDFPFKEVASFTSDLHEAYLRLHHLKSECFLGRVVIFSHDGFLGSGQEDDLDHGGREKQLAMVNMAGEEICAGLSRMRDQDLQTGESPRSIMIDPMPDGSLYLQYRSCFYTLRGRTRWRRALAVGENLRTPAEFEASLRDFELAQGGLGVTNPLLAVVAEFSVIEISLARARLLLYPEPPDDGCDPISTARAYYETARGALQRARQNLSSGRRNVVWWKKYYQLVSQYQADRLLLDYTRWLRDWTPDEPPTGDLPFFLIRLRRGYDAIRSALDYFLPERSAGGDHHAVRSRWLVRTWWEITLSSYAAGILVACRALGKGQKEAHRLVGDYLEWLNGSATLVRHQGGIPAGIHHEFSGLLAIFRQPDPNGDLLGLESQLGRESVFARRRKILELAQRFSV